MVLGLMLLAACGQADAPKPAAAAPGPLKTVKDWFDIKVGAIPVRMQFAVKMTEMQQGLMGRTDLADREGMIFVYRTPQQMSFWMHNTPTALDIGFFSSDGVLREIYPMYPFDETTVASRRSDLQYALELKQGGFAQAGLKVGDQLDLVAVKRALEARGYAATGFRGLPDE